MSCHPTGRERQPGQQGALRSAADLDQLTVAPPRHRTEQRDLDRAIHPTSLVDRLSAGSENFSRKSRQICRTGGLCFDV